MTNRHIARVVYVKQDRAYFFVLHEGRRTFCHISEWGHENLPQIGDWISFELKPARMIGKPDECAKALPAQHVGAVALAAHQTVQVVGQNVQVVRTVEGAE